VIVVAVAVAVADADEVSFDLPFLPAFQEVGFSINQDQTRQALVRVRLQYGKLPKYLS
jgi:hypothetical protein